MRVLFTKCFASCGAVLYSRKCSATNVDKGSKQVFSLEGSLFTQKYLLDSMKFNPSNSTGFGMIDTGCSERINTYILLLPTYEHMCGIDLLLSKLSCAIAHDDVILDLRAPCV